NRDLAVFGRARGESVAFDGGLQQAALRRIVIDDQDRFCHDPHHVWRLSRGALCGTIRTRCGGRVKMAQSNAISVSARQHYLKEVFTTFAHIPLPARGGGRGWGEARRFRICSVFEATYFMRFCERVRVGLSAEAHPTPCPLPSRGGARVSFCAA